MSLQHSVNLILATPSELRATTAVKKALKAAGIKRFDWSGSSVGESKDPAGIRITHWVVADDRDELERVIRESVAADGIEIRELRITSRLVEPARVNARGVEFDRATGTVTIETWHPEYVDLDLMLFMREDYINGSMASSRGDGRVMDSFPGLRRIIVRRPDGNYVPVDGESPAPS